MDGHLANSREGKKRAHKADDPVRALILDGTCDNRIPNPFAHGHGSAIAPYCKMDLFLPVDGNWSGGEHLAYNQRNDQETYGVFVPFADGGDGSNVGENLYFMGYGLTMRKETPI